MAEPMLIVLGILAGAVALWSWGRPRADVVAVLIVLALMVSGVLTPQESLAGFGDPVVILIAAVFVVGAALENTGIVHRLSLALLKLGAGSETRLIVLIMLLVGVLTAFMSSTAVTAMFIPVVLAISGRTGLNRKRMLMPLAVAACLWARRGRPGRPIAGVTLTRERQASGDPASASYMLGVRGNARRRAGGHGGTG